MACFRSLADLFRYSSMLTLVLVGGKIEISADDEGWGVEVEIALHVAGRQTERGTLNFISLSWLHPRLM